MSKMDGLRAMREARYERTEARRAAAPARERPPVAPADPELAEVPAATPVRRPAARAAKKVETTATAAAGGAEALCGHRNMGGRTCTRELGHTAKSHRYS